MSVTAEQLDLPALVLGGRSLGSRFQQWLRDNPTVYQEAVELARELKNAGHSRIGTKFIFEVLRYKRMLRTTDPENFKINNNYSSRLAREIERREPDLRGLFETRELRAS